MFVQACECVGKAVCLAAAQDLGDNICSPVKVGQCTVQVWHVPLHALLALWYYLRTPWNSRYHGLLA